MGNYYHSSYSVSQEWLEAFNKLNSVSKPKIISKPKWLDIHYNAITLFENDVDILQAIIKSNWTLNDIFGCHYLAPMTRFDCMGLLLLKSRQETIVKVSEDIIQLKTRNGIIKHFYKFISIKEKSLIYKLEN